MNMAELVNVTPLVLAPDGQSLFASGLDQNLLCWDLGKRNEPIMLCGRSATLNALAMSRDGHSLASAVRDMKTDLRACVRLALQESAHPGAQDNAPAYGVRELAPI